MNQRFRAHQRLKKNVDFVDLIKLGERASGACLDMRALKKRDESDSALAKLGIIVSRRVSAVAAKRNRWKRLIREAYRKLQHKINPHYAVLVRVKPGPIKTPQLQEVLKEFEELLRKLRLV